AAATPFHSPAWLLPWWRHFGCGRLAVFAAFADGELVGLLPAFTFERAPGVRVAALVGAGISDYVGALVDAAFGGDALEPLARALEALDAVEIECDAQAEGAPLLASRLAAAADVQDAEPSPVLAVPPGARALADVVPKQQRRNFDKARRKAEQVGALAFTTADAATRAALLDALVSLHEARWRAAGQPSGVLGDPRVTEFHREATTRLLEAGLLRLHGVILDGRPIATLYAMHHRATTYLYLQGYDVAFDAVSPGCLATGYAVERALADGARTIDFLRGRERYKYLWGARDRAARRLRIAR
ncbi:MAG TPA: GNAT family N-acetyltransferase, partial [Minicystis sp.]|nr:GNAT family N-acetyltransferase [Minicystis sp.]